jgi:hypothetical protein
MREPVSQAAEPGADREMSYRTPGGSGRLQDVQQNAIIIR